MTNPFFLPDDKYKGYRAVIQVLREITPSDLFVYIGLPRFEAHTKHERFESQTKHTAGPMRSPKRGRRNVRNGAGRSHQY